MKSLLIYLAMILLSNSCLFSQNLPKRIYMAQRLTSNEPKIDGNLNDACWSGNGWMGDFIQQMPNEGQSPSDETEFKIVYDDENLYVGFRAFFQHVPMDIRMARRDDFSGDCVGVCFDSYYDHRTGYEFIIQASGSKIDIIQMDAGGQWFYNYNWDAVWEGKTAVEDSVWTAEMRIPFSQLRFAKKEKQVWGLHVWRWINLKMEESQFQLIPQDSQGRVHQFGVLKGIQNIPSPRRIELMPYMRVNVHTFQRQKENPFQKTGYDWEQSLGMDGKLGLSGNFNVDFTVNPDFGQVEADPSIVNLTAFETFYDEKRPFFIEGSQMLEFGFGGQSLFYSRRIGRSPGYSPSLNEGEFISIPDRTTILGAVKISGKTANGWAIGALSSLTARETAEIKNKDNRFETVEPLSNCSVLRVQRDFKQGSHSFGAMFTSVHRFISNESLNFMPNAAYTGGLDGTIQWGDRTYYINAKGVFSHVRGHQEAISQLQKSSVHYYHRIDAKHLTFDSTRTSLTGTGGDFEIGKGGNGRWRFEESVSWRSPGLELNDIGFLKQADVIEQGTHLAYVVNEPIHIFNSYEFSADQYNSWDFNRTYLSMGAEIFGQATFRNFMSMHGSIYHERDRIQTRLLRGGPAMRLPDLTQVHLHIFSDSRRRVQGNVGIFKTFFNDKLSLGGRILAGLYIRATDNLELSFEPEYEYNCDDWQYVKVDNLITDPTYILGKIDHKTLKLTFRCSYYITPDLSVQYYGQPFLSSGVYSNFRRVTQSTASKINDRTMDLNPDRVQTDSESGDLQIDENLDGTIDYRIENPNFNFREFRSNLVLRWEYRPGSVLYLVWTHDRSQRIVNHGFNLNHDLHELFRICPDNVFLLKLNYWFSL